MGGPWENYGSQDSSAGPWAKYGGQSSAPPAPTSGPIPGAYKPTMPTPGVADNAAYEAVEGAKGFGKGLAQTAQTIHNNNTPKDPRNSLFANPENYAGSGMNTTAENPDQQMGKFLEAGAEMAAPIGDAKAMLPSAERAGSKLGQMGKSLADHSVWMDKSMPELTRAKEISDAGGGTMGAAGKLLKRSSSELLDFPQTRDFSSNISRQSADTAMNQTPMMRRQIGKVAHAVNEDLGNTAEGAMPATQYNYRGEPMNGGKYDFNSNMREYGQAKGLSDLASKYGKKAAIGGATAIGAGEVYRHGRDLFGR